jgi:hypothetical protein
MHKNDAPFALPPRQRCDFCQGVKAEFMYARRDTTMTHSPTYRICAACMREGNCAFACTTQFFSK